MTFLSVVLLAVILWFLWKMYHSENPKNGAHEIPIAVKVSVSSSNTTDMADIDKDNWEGSFWEVQEPFPVKATLRIEYEDGAGKKTERVVDIHQFGADLSGGLLIGHCRMRNATRTFRFDRIKKCVDDETGEIVDDIYSYLRAKYESSPEHARDKFYEDEYDTLRVLFYVGKADGQLRAAEKAIIRETCRALANDSRMTDEVIDDLFSSLDVPTIHAFKLAVGRLAKKAPEARAMLVKAAEDMIATQKTVHPSEKEALDYMYKKMVEGVV